MLINGVITAPPSLQPSGSKSTQTPNKFNASVYNVGDAIKQLRAIMTGNKRIK